MQINKELWLEQKNPIIWKGIPITVYTQPMKEYWRNKLRTTIMVNLNAEKATWEKVDIDEIEVMGEV